MSSNPEEAQLVAHYAEQSRKILIARARDSQFLVKPARSHEGAISELARRAVNLDRPRIAGRLTPRWSTHPRDWRYADTSVPLEKALSRK